MIGVDWGTTQLRAYRIGADGTILATRTEPKGIMAVPPERFEAVLEEVIGDWLSQDPEPFLLSGMVGSRQGWLEVPYVACPAYPTSLAKSLTPVSCGGKSGYICPGLSCLDAHGVPDVLRGEEVQVFGGLAMAPDPPSLVCHPGTHSKHVRVQDGGVRQFATHMTGELFGLLCDHSILGRTMEPGPTDWDAFDDGVLRARQAGGLLHHLFGARTRVLMSKLSPGSEADYLSGMLIGHEINATGSTGPVLVIGAAELEARYLRAFARCGLDATAVSGAVATARGLRLVHGLRGSHRV